ncbi:putative membrane protein, partial [Chlamydia psittaci 10_743_SC13]
MLVFEFGVCCCFMYCYWLSLMCVGFFFVLFFSLVLFFFFCCSLLCTV